MMTYASIASLTINCNNVANRMNLGFAGVIAPVLAIASSFGFASAIGIEFTNIVGVMPFLVVGIGIDDMFILMSGMADAPPLSKSSIMERVVFMMQKSGIAITITSLTDLLAFVIGATSVFKSIRNFCIYTGVAVFFCYLNQLFFLCPAIRLNEGRTKEKRHFCLCWKEVQPDNHYIGHSKCFTRCTAGHPPETREDVESPMEKYPKNIMLFMLSSLWGKVLITISFMTYLAAAIYGCFHLEQGLQLYNLAAKDSYFYTYSAWDNEFYTIEPYVQILSSTLQTIGIAVAVMLFVTFAFMPDVRVVLIVCVTLVCILVGIFGFMHFWDLTLSSITMIHLVMSVGFSVDFTVHVCHAFISVEGDERKEVLIKALDRSGGPIVNAAFSTLLGILMLGFSSSYIFISFGKVMFLVIAFGLIHSAFFLPLLLYWLSPFLRKHAMTKVSSSSPCMDTEMNAEKFPPITDSTEKTKKSDNFTDLSKPKY
ncbi:patched domain-containing protein 3-like [Ostrea edulis]|uniref:patched domain-containing protein 3-like n=1 Tax=Ostrea edulis TaxID=37623 RepID=UPI0024AF22B6|nr:patched domain-containing protein 3-like [Ostrea edulis]